MCISARTAGITLALNEGLRLGKLLSEQGELISGLLVLEAHQLEESSVKDSFMLV